MRLGAGGALLSPIPAPGHHSTHAPPHEQLLVRLGVGGLSSLSSPPMIHPTSSCS
ncbi:hypothetical protein L208DRAFT_1400028 [Tricholoma matsutake]|nr:hypothetical protein L208DRAFT_1400028 [Tricholoma matsutake 945]